MAQFNAWQNHGKTMANPWLSQLHGKCIAQLTGISMQGNKVIFIEANWRNGSAIALGLVGSEGMGSNEGIVGIFRSEGSVGSWQRVELAVGRGLRWQLAEGRGLSWQRVEWAVGRGFRWQLAEGSVGIWQTVECWLFGLVGFLVSSWPEQFSRVTKSIYIRVVGWTLGQFLARAVLQGSQ